MSLSSSDSTNASAKRPSRNLEVPRDTRHLLPIHADEKGSSDHRDGTSKERSSSEQTPARSRAHRPSISEAGRTALAEIEEAVQYVDESVVRFWDRFRGKGRWVSWTASVRAIVFSSWINILFLLLPFAWASHFMNEREEGRWPTQLTFALCFLAIIPMEKMFDFGGEQMAFYLGKSLGDLVVITLNNVVEATLGILLLLKCDVKLLQSTIAGVVLLHLLLVPGTAFLTGGARIWEQNLHPHPTELNHSLLTIGVLTLLIPTAFWSSISNVTSDAATTAVTDANRDIFLRMSRGLAVILLIVYIASRIYLHNPPGEDNALRVRQDAPEEIKEEEDHLVHDTPEVNVWACLALLAITITLMAVTAEFLVESIESVRDAGSIKAEWFGLILLPIVSFSADGVVAVAFFARYTLALFLGKPSPPATLAKGRAIDLSIQFTMFWMPFLVLLGWWTGHPLSLLFDPFEVALLIGACFLVNYVTADAKTNWVEGCIMVAFYLMIALAAWFYPGQPDIAHLVQCGGVSASSDEIAEVVEVARRILSS